MTTGQRPRADGPVISVVIPVYNEVGAIGALVRETVEQVGADMLHEIVVVDDASDDGTRETLVRLRAEVPKLVVVRHARRCGQSAAIRSGVLAATGPVVATMDGDGQNDPADIRRLALAVMTQAGEPPGLVGGIRIARKAEGSKRQASRFANWLRDRVLADGCPDTGCGLKVFRRDAFVQLPYFSGMHRYLPALFQAYGWRVAYEPVRDRPRLSGASKYTNFGRALIGIYDLIGVRWLIKRTVVPGPVIEVEQAAANGQPGYEEAQTWQQA